MVTLPDCTLTASDEPLPVKRLRLIVTFGAFTVIVPVTSSASTTALACDTVIPADFVKLVPPGTPVLDAPGNSVLGGRVVVVVAGLVVVVVARVVVVVDAGRVVVVVPVLGGGASGSANATSTQ